MYHPTKQNGMALILVLMFTALLTLVVTSFQYKSASNIQLATLAKAQLSARAELESKKTDFNFKLVTTPLWLFPLRPDQLQEFGLPPDLNFYGKPFIWDNVTISLQDSSGLISVHPFEPRQWEGLLRALGAENADHIAAAFADWIDEDDFLHLNGAERGDYARLDLPRNDLPQLVPELALIKGMSSLWHKLAPYITYIGPGVITPHFAPEQILPYILGPYRAEQMELMRQGTAADVSNLMIQQSEDSLAYLSNRILVNLHVKIEDASYQLSYTALRGFSGANVLFMGEKMPGFVRVELK